MNLQALSKQEVKAKKDVLWQAKKLPARALKTYSNTNRVPLAKAGRLMDSKD